VSGRGIRDRNFKYFFRLLLQKSIKKLVTVGKLNYYRDFHFLMTYIKFHVVKNFIMTFLYMQIFDHVYPLYYSFLLEIFFF
jgi:hypothetical protein